MADRGTQHYISLEPVLFTGADYSYNPLVPTDLGNQEYLNLGASNTPIEVQTEGQLWPRGNPIITT